MTLAPPDHVRGALVTPAIDWLGQLVSERSRPLTDLDHVLKGCERELLFAPPNADAWVPSLAARNVVDALVGVHGGQTTEVLRELGRRTTPRIASLANAPVDRLALRLSRLIHLGRWRAAPRLLPGDLLELHSSQPIAPTLLDWIGGLVNSALHGGMRPSRITEVQLRRESACHIVFVRCAV